MKHITSLMLALLLSLSLTACGDVQTPGTPSEIPTSAPVPAPTEDDPPKVLIAYFTWADNTVVEDEDEAIQSALDHYESMGDRGNYDVDAISSASIVPPGNTAQLAAWIQQEVGGELHSILVEDPYPSNYDECLDRAADEKAEGARPVLSVTLRRGITCVFSSERHRPIRDSTCSVCAKIALLKWRH